MGGGECVCFLEMAFRLAVRAMSYRLLLLRERFEESCIKVLPCFSKDDIFFFIAYF